MEIAREKVDVATGPTDEKNYLTETTIEIPTLVNTKVIQKGTALTYFKAAAESKKRPFDVI